MAITTTEKKLGERMLARGIQITDHREYHHVWEHFENVLKKAEKLWKAKKGTLQLMCDERTR